MFKWHFVNLNSACSSIWPIYLAPNRGCIASRAVSANKSVVTFLATGQTLTISSEIHKATVYSRRAPASGYATCGVGHRAIEVVRDDNGVKTTVALSAGSYCECRAAVCFPLHAFTHDSPRAAARSISIRWYHCRVAWRTNYKCPLGVFIQLKMPKFQLNSAIESLVTGAGLPSSLPALTATGAPLVGSG